MPWRGAEYPGEFPTLGFQVAALIEASCAIPDGEHAGEPYVLTDEQLRFLLWHYRLDPETVRDERGRWRRPFKFFRGSQLVRPQKWGKALALDTSVPVPGGWATMGDLGVGDEVFSDTGAPCRVAGRSPVWVGADCYRVEFTDGESVVASGDHLWTVEDRNAGYAPVVRTTRAIAECGVMSWGDEARRWRVPVAGALKCPRAELPVDPYVLGAWLGDGCINDSRVVGVDEGVFAEIAAAGFEVRRGAVARRRTVIGLRPRLRELGVLAEKHIPGAYLRASVAQRRSLLQGLMDTDGYAERARCEFTTVLPALRDGVVELVASLGLKPRVIAGRSCLDGVDKGPKWRVCFMAYADGPAPFRLGRKLARLRVAPARRLRSAARHISAVTRIASVPTVCIEVDSPSRCFLVGRRMIPTHNSPFSAAMICAEAHSDGPVLFDGWDAAGEPVGRPWPTPHVQVTAVSEDQVANVFRALLPMIELGAVAADIPDTGHTRINLPSGGLIEPVTASAVSRLGQRVTFVVQDQTESWTRENRGRDLADNQRRGLAGMGGRWMETPNAWDPAGNSVAQQTSEGREVGVYLDDVDPGPGSIRNKTERRRMLRKAYGDAWWVDLDRIDAEIEALLDRDPAQAERWFLNRKRAGEAAAIDPHRWTQLADREHQAPDGTLIVIGVDGARFSDALAIVATEVQSGFQWPLGIWERPSSAPADYEHPLDLVDGAMVDAFDRYVVWRAYVDPQWIEHLLDRWQGRWGDKRVVPWWTNRPRPIAWAVRNYLTAIAAGDVTHNGDPEVAAHIANARRQKLNIFDDEHRQMHTISKDRPDSPRKIDAAMAAVLSWEARGDAIASGANTPLTEPLVAWAG